MTLNDPIDNHDSEKMFSENDSSSNLLSNLATNYTKQLLRRKAKLSRMEKVGMDFIQFADYQMTQISIITALIGISVGLQANDRSVIVAAFNSAKE